MRSQIALRLRSTSIPLSAVPPASTSIEYSTYLADIAARILYRSPLPSQDDLPVFILNSAALPDAKHTEYDALLPYVLARLPDEEELIGGQGYEVVFFAGGSNDGSRATATKKGRPGWGWFLQAYHVLSRAMRKRLKKLYIVHEKNWVKILVEMFSTAVSPKFRKKIVHVSTLTMLAPQIPIENLLIPPSAYFTDRRLSKNVIAPYTSGRRAFAVKEPLPLSSQGAPRLPRVLRETSSFVTMDPLIKTEGVFRISPRAITVDILTEAYDRGQKFIVWKDGDVSLSHGHMREGTGVVYVEELEQTEGYDLHAAAALIKQWYKELRDPIFPQSCYPALERFYGATYSETEQPLKVSQLLEILAVDDEWSPISKTARAILTMHLLPLLSRVTDFQDCNQMTAYNLAVCFAPCLLCGPDPIEDVRVASIIRRILMALIMHWKSDLAPRFDMDLSKFEESLRTPEAVEDREDPLQEVQGPRSSFEAQISGITLIDNEDSDEEIERPPPLPPRPTVSPIETTPPPPDSTAVRRKPAPPIQSLPRYSMIVSESPATLEHIQFYNTVAIEEELDPSLPGGLLDVQELPEYQAPVAPHPSLTSPKIPSEESHHATSEFPDHKSRLPSVDALPVSPVPLPPELENGNVQALPLYKPSSSAASTNAPTNAPTTTTTTTTTTAISPIPALSPKPTPTSTVTRKPLPNAKPPPS